MIPSFCYHQPIDLFINHDIDYFKMRKIVPTLAILAVLANIHDHDNPEKGLS